MNTNFVNLKNELINSLIEYRKDNDLSNIFNDDLKEFINCENYYFLEDCIINHLYDDYYNHKDIYSILNYILFLEKYIFSEIFHTNIKSFIFYIKTIYFDFNEFELINFIKENYFINYKFLKQKQNKNNKDWIFYFFLKEEYFHYELVANIKVIGNYIEEM